MNDTAWVNWLVDQAQPGQRIIDIGAHVGLFTLPLAAKVGPAGHVWAVEPGLVAVQELEEQAKAAGNVTVIHAALSDREDCAVLFLDRRDSRHNSLYLPTVDKPRPGAESFQPIELMRLDKMWRRGDLPVHADWIKVDAQGAEGAILSCAAPYLADVECAWMVEWWPYGLECGGWAPERLAGALQALDLSVFVLDTKGGSLGELSWCDVLKRSVATLVLGNEKAINLGFAHKGSSKWPIR